MNAILDRLSGWRWPVLAILASLAMLGAAHFFERVLLLAPCPLCLKQREVYWAVVAMAVTGLALWRWQPTRRFLIAFNILIGLAFLVGAVVAFYHMGVEYGWFAAPSGCAAGASRESIVGGQIDLDQPVAVAACTESLWVFLGLSMAAWNGIVSMMLAGLSFVAASRTAQLRSKG